MLAVANDVLKTLKPLRKCNMNVHFNPEHDYIDSVATDSIPSDGSKNVDAIWIPGDGNCCSRSLSKGYIGHENMHLEVCARTVIEGIIHKEYYLNSSYLERGASLVREDEPLAVVYMKYSDYYVSGQKVTNNTLEYMYTREIHQCA